MPRYDAPAPFEGAYVEYSDAWSVGQRNRFWADKDEPFLALLRSKTVAIYLPAEEGEAITTADDITADDMDRLDLRLYEWFRGTWLTCLLDIGKLGEALRRSLFVGYDETNSTTTTGGE